MKTAEEIFFKYGFNFMQTDKGEKVKEAILECAKQEAIGFAKYIQDNFYRKLKSTYPIITHVGKWYSDYCDTGFLTDEQLYQLYLDNKQK